MIDHSKCTHPRTPSGRAKCRRGQTQVGFSPPLYSLGPPPRKGATPKTIGDDESYGQTPRDRHMECDKCGVERMLYRGTDMVSGILLYVGAKCLWYIKDSEDLTPLD